jgi:integrase
MQRITGHFPVRVVHVNLLPGNGFASVIALANNVSLPNVAKMLGHSSTRMTQHYAKVLDQTILRDMQAVEEQLAL